MTSLYKQINFIVIATVVTTAISLVACTEEVADGKEAAENKQTEIIVSPVLTEDKIAQLQREAQAGDPDAQYNLAYLYENGLGVPKDETKALELYQQAADQGHPAAQNNLDAMSASK
jgi:TPR repeat protein